jgi:hypothetical protein
LLDESPAKIEPIAGNPNTTGRRTALARWLTNPANPLTSRVFVNRIWQHHFGRGLAGTPSDFGHLGESPSHPELLDWLVAYFVSHNWSTKEIHKLILTSSTYRQSAIAGSETIARASTVDPENRLLWRQTVRRLESDQIRDALLAVSGELDLKENGPSVDAFKPRRTIYVKWLRNSHDPLLDVFDPPDAYASSPQRNVTTTPLQSLALLNGRYVLQRAQMLANRLQKTGGHEPEQLVSTAYQIAFGRAPSARERQQGETFLRDQTQLIAKSQLRLAALASEGVLGANSTGISNPDTRQTRAPAPDNHQTRQDDLETELDPSMAALVDLCHVLLNSNEFLYVD